MATEIIPGSIVPAHTEPQAQPVVPHSEVTPSTSPNAASEAVPVATPDTVALDAFHTQVNAELVAQHREQQNADYAAFHDRLNTALEQGSNLDTSFQWGHRSESLPEVTQKNWLDQGAHLADFSWGSTVTPVAEMQPEVPAFNAPTVETQAVKPVVPEVPTATVAANELPTDEYPVVESSRFVPVPVSVPVEVRRASNTVPAIGRARVPGDAYAVQGNQNAAETVTIPAVSENDTDTTEIQPVPAQASAEQVTSAAAPTEMSPQKQTWRARIVGRLAARQAARNADEWLPGYGPREATDDDNLVTVGEENDNRFFVGHVSVVDKGIVELPNGGMSKSAYKALRADNKNLPEEGVAAALRPDQRDQLARDQIRADVQAQVDRDQAGRAALMTEIRGYMPRMPEEDGTAYMRRLRVEFDHRVAERYYDATVAAGVPLTRMAPRGDRYVEKHLENPNDYVNEEGITHRLFRRLVGLGATALGFRSNLNTYDALREQGAFTEESEEKQAA